MYFTASDKSSMDKQRMAKAKAKDKDLRRVTATAISSMCLLLFPLIYATFFPLNISQYNCWRQLSNWGSMVGDDRDASLIGGSNMKHGSAEDEDSLNFPLRRLVQGKDRSELDTTGFTCKSDLLTDVCVSNQHVKLDTSWQGSSPLTVTLSSIKSAPQHPHSRLVKPYARKYDPTAMGMVKPVKIRTPTRNDVNATAACKVIHDVPAVVFSTGGYTGNIFHDFNDVIFPLFITCRQFKSKLRFVITDYKSSWVRKYHQVLSHLSNYEIIDPTTDGRVHCFPATVIGLNYHDTLGCNVSDLPVGHSTRDFKRFLHDAFSLKFMDLSLKQDQKPLLVLLSRRNTRRFLNEDEMVKVADELGFRVMVATPNQTLNLDEFAEVVNSCSVMVGAHGAGLTNAVFLPAGAVLIQVVPLGLDWVSKTYYHEPFLPMGIQYLEYRIRPEESTLSELYGLDHPVITDPESIHRKGYVAARAVYLDEQSVKPMPHRFRETLSEALKLIGR